MKILITARHFKAHDTLKELIYDELGSLERYFDDIMEAEVILSFTNNVNSIKTAEIILQVPGPNVTAKEETDDFQKSIVGAVQKLTRQLEKIKTKKTAVR